MESALALGLLSVNLLIAGGVASDHFPGIRTPRRPS
jgi:hypothetical protein